MKHKLLTVIFFLFLPFTAFCQSQGVKKVAVLEVVDKEQKVTYGIKLMLRSTLAEAISHTSGYEAYDRNYLDQIMKEQSFQRTGMVSDADIKRIGEMTGVAFVLVPEAAYLDDARKKITVSATLTNIESAKAETATAFSEVDDFDEACTKLVGKLLGVQLSGSGVSNSSDNTGFQYGQGSDQTFTVGGVRFKMVYVQGGSFTMGATSEQESEADDDEKPAHQVTLDAYYIGEYEVTQALWQAVMGTTVYQQRDKANTSWPMRGVGDDYPMYYVSYNEAQEFCGYLNRLLRDRLQGRRFALPTEAQWEYAARGGNRSRHYKYAGSNDVSAVAYYDGNSGSQNHSVGLKAPNELGLYDMSGNVWEWCSDWYGSGYYSSSSSNNPAGPSSGSNRVLRGGGWGSKASSCRVSNRGIDTPDARYYIYGFRVALLP